MTNWPGMTPTTVSAEIVAAALRAGYHAELAGGGLPTERIFVDRIDEVLRMAFYLMERAGS